MAMKLLRDLVLDIVLKNRVLVLDIVLKKQISH